MIDEVTLARHVKVCNRQDRVSSALALELVAEVRRLHQETRELRAQAVRGATAFNGGLRVGRDPSDTVPAIMLDCGVLPPDLAIMVIEPGPDLTVQRPAYQVDPTTLVVACRLLQADVRRRQEQRAALADNARAAQEGETPAEAEDPVATDPGPPLALADATLPSRLLGGPPSVESIAAVAPVEVP